jgi:serine protease Do
MSGFADNMGFAIPSATVSLLVDQLREGKVQWTWTGLQLQPLRDFNRDIYFDGEEGVIVSETDPDSPARRAGIKQDDRILAVNGAPLNALTEEDLPAVRRRLGLLPNGEPAEFVVQRGLETFALELTPREKGEVEGEELALPRWDFSVKEINQFDNPEQYWYKKQGVFVFGVKWPGNASSAGLQQGDILIRVGQEKVETLEDVKRIHAEAIENIDSRTKVILQILRGGLTRQVVLDYARDYERR